MYEEAKSEGYQKVSANVERVTVVGFGLNFWILEHPGASNGTSITGCEGESKPCCKTVEEGGPADVREGSAA